LPAPGSPHTTGTPLCPPHGLAQPGASITIAAPRNDRSDTRDNAMTMSRKARPAPRIIAIHTLATMSTTIFGIDGKPCEIELPVAKRGRVIDQNRSSRLISMARNFWKKIASF